MFSKAGCDDARTYIQSGNVIFCAAPKIAASLPDLIAGQIAKRFGFTAPVVLRTAEQIGAVIRDNPYVKAGVAENELHVLFLADAPAAGNIADLNPDRSQPDTFTVLGQEVYLRLPNGAGKTKLTAQYFDSKLSTIGTQRNWRTVNKLFELMQG